MGNIWGMLLQGITVSLTAILLLVIKRVMADKLSPRWQYGVWSVLALRILLPVSMKRNIVGMLPFWMETWKSIVESHLSSAYSAVYEPISIRSVLPYFETTPVSVTDWLLLLYAAGIVLCALRYLISYLRLRHLLRRGEPVSELDSAMVMARLNRCSTKAGALDTYAKSLMFDNGIYLAMVSPLEEHEELKAQMQRSEDSLGVYYLDSGWELEYVQQEVLYKIYNLRQRDNGDYEATLGFYVKCFPDKSGEGYLKNEDGEEIYYGAVLIPVRLWYDGGWMVEESGERQILEHRGALWTKVNSLRTLTAQGQFGTVTIEKVVEYSIPQTVQQTDSFFGWENTRVGEPDVEAEFGDGFVWSMYTYDMNTKTVEEAPKGKEMVGVYVAIPSNPQDEISFADTFGSCAYGCDELHHVTDSIVSGKHNAWGTYKHIGYSWDGLLNGGGGIQFYGGGDEPASLPEKYQAAIYWAGKRVETVTLREAEDE